MRLKTFSLLCFDYGAWNAPMATTTKKAHLVALAESQLRAARVEHRPASFTPLLAWHVLWRQARTIPRSLWLASTLCIIAATIYAMLVSNGHGMSALTFGLPLVAAGGMAFVYGKETDPALEISLATATSARAILLSRVTLLIGFNLALGLVATAIVSSVHGYSIGTIVTLWLGPAALLSSGSLLLSVILGPFVAAAFAGTAVITQAVHVTDHLRVSVSTDALWQTSPLLFVLAGALLVLAVLYTPRQQRFA